MTTNHMGLEQTLSDERLELLITSLIMSTAVAQQTQSFAPSFATQNELQVAALRELLAYRKAGKEPVAWESTTTCYVKYVTDKRYQGFSDQVKQWYKPYKCSNCAATQPQAMVVPDEVTFEQARLMAYGLTPAEAFQKAWNHLRGKILKSVTNEP